MLPPATAVSVLPRTRLLATAPRMEPAAFRLMSPPAEASIVLTDRSPLVAAIEMLLLAEPLRLMALVTRVGPAVVMPIAPFWVMTDASVVPAARLSFR